MVRVGKVTSAIAGALAVLRKGTGDPYGKLLAQVLNPTLSDEQVLISLDGLVEARGLDRNDLSRSLLPRELVRARFARAEEGPQAPRSFAEFVCALDASSPIGQNTDLHLMHRLLRIAPETSEVVLKLIAKEEALADADVRSR